MGTRKSGVIRKPKTSSLEARYAHAQIVHDMRGAIYALKLGLATLDGASADELSDTVSDMRQTLDRFEQLIHRLVHAVPNVKEVSLRDLVEQAVRFFWNHEYESVTIDCSGVIDVRVTLDVLLFTSALANLIKNSVEAVQAGSGRIVVGASLVVSSAASDAGFALAVDAEEMLCVFVEDNGSGIPPHILSGFGQHRATTKRAGSGIGITVVNTFVESCHGELQISSSAEKGTKISLLIPLRTS
jgi:signal transduction histidine kinase